MATAGEVELSMCRGCQQDPAAAFPQRQIRTLPKAEAHTAGAPGPCCCSGENASPVELLQVVTLTPQKCQIQQQGKMMEML